MKHFLLTLGLLFSLTSQAAVEVKIGDILLQPTDCWSCSLIEEEHDTIYSHLGIVVQVKPEILVAESLGKVRAVPLKEFDSKTQKDQQLLVLRFNNNELINHFEAHKTQLMSLFQSEFESKPYDKEFLWNNFDGSGVEKLYCSEFIAKFLQAFAGIEPKVRKMHFTKNREMWARYFHGNIPDGKWGNAPSDYHDLEMFHEVGEL